MPVIAPWPISMAGATMVMVPSGAMVTQMFGEKPPTCANTRARRPPIAKVKVRPAAEPATKARREMAVVISGLLRRALDGAHDAAIRPAPADVAVHPLHDLRARRLGRLLEQGGGLHDLSRLAVAALQHLLLDPRLLKRMAGAVRRQPFDRGHRLALHLAHARDARAHRLALEVHGAGTALRHAAAELGAREVQLFA